MAKRATTRKADTTEAVGVAETTAAPADENCRKIAEVKDAQGRTIIDIIDDINTTLGRGHACIGSECDLERNTLKSGCVRLDLAVGCGGLPIPDGVFIEIYGPEGSGKSTLALTAIAQLHKIDKEAIAVYIDLEHTLKTKGDMAYAEKLGVDLKRLLPVQASTGEDAITTLEKALIHPNVKLAVIDSVKNMHTTEQLQREPDDKPLMAPLAKFCANNLPKILRLINLDQYNRKSVILLNQVYIDIMSYGTPEKAPGGKALEHLCQVIIHVQKRKTLAETVFMDKDGNRSWASTRPTGSIGKMGYSVEGTIMKSRVSGSGAQMNTFKFKLIKDDGIDRLYDILSGGMVTGVFLREGTSGYRHVRMNGDGTLHDVIPTVRGIDNFIAYIGALNYEEIYNEILTAGTIKYLFD